RQADDDVEEVAERPAPKRGKARDEVVETPRRKGRRDEPEDDFEEVDDRRDDDYDDDYDEDRPRKGKGKKGKSAGIPTDEVTEEDTKNAFNMYLYTLLGSFFCGPVGLIIFFIMWLGKRKESPLVDWHGKQV